MNVRLIAQMFAQRAKCYLLLGQPENALNELTLLNNSRHVLEAAPTGRPITLIAAMVDVTIAGLYVNTIADGLQSHAWREPQLVALQAQLKGINLAPIFAKGFEFESAESCRSLELMLRKYPNDPSLWQDISHFRFPWWKWMPRGWVYQNMATVANLDYKQFNGFDFENGTILPDKMESAGLEVKMALKHFSPYNFLVVMEDDVPNTLKAAQALAYNQTLANEAQIVCALGRYRLANGKYPETLAALTPQFIAKIPPDLIGGKPLNYSRKDDQDFLLYSIGWNEADDGGITAFTSDGKEDRERGDWVWHYPVQ